MPEKINVVIRTDNDIKVALFYVRKLLTKLSFSEVDKQKVIVSVSELTQNILDHADSHGSFTCEEIGVCGIQIIVEDWGKGIDQLDEISDGRMKKRGLGLGLAGAKRLMDQFHVETSKGGTKIIAVKWGESQKTKSR